MRLIIVVLIVLTQLKEYEQSSSYPTSYERRQDSYFGSIPHQNQYGSSQQMNPFEKYQNPQQSYAPLPQEALTKTTIHYIPPSQAEKPVKLPQNIEGYQLVNSGLPPGSDYNQGQLNTPQIPQNFQGNSQFASQNPASYQNDYHTGQDYYGKTPTTNIPPPPVQSDNHQTLFPYNFRGQNQYQTASQNIDRLPHHFSNELSSIPSQNIDPFGIANPSADLNSKMAQQYFQQSLPQKRDIQSPPPYAQQQQYTINQISADILPYLSQLNLPQYLPNQQSAPQNGQYLPNQQSAPQNGQYLPAKPNFGQNGPYLPNQLNGFQNGQYLQGSNVPSPGQGNYFNDAFLQLSNQQSQSQRETQLNKEGYQVVNEVVKNQNGIYAQSQQKNAQINDEGYQVVNEAPVTHYVSVGQPNTKIINLQQSPPRPVESVQPFQISRSQVPKSYNVYNEQAIVKDIISIQNKQQQQPLQQPQNQQPEVSDLEPQSKESQKRTELKDLEVATCSADNPSSDSCACDICSKRREN